MTEHLEPARVLGRFPWQCPHCGHRREDHTGPVPTEAAGPGFGSCTGCPSCTGPERR